MLYYLHAGHSSAFIGTCASKNGTFPSKLHFWKHIPSCDKSPLATLRRETIRAGVVWGI